MLSGDAAEGVVCAVICAVFNAFVLVDMVGFAVFSTTADAAGLRGFFKGISNSVISSLRGQPKFFKHKAPASTCLQTLQKRSGQSQGTEQK